MAGETGPLEVEGAAEADCSLVNFDCLVGEYDDGALVPATRAIG